MRFFTRPAPTVLPCARRGGSVTPATTGGAGATTRSARSTGASSVGSTRTGGESSRRKRVVPSISGKEAWPARIRLESRDRKPEARAFARRT